MSCKSSWCSLTVMLHSVLSPSPWCASTQTAASTNIDVSGIAVVPQTTAWHFLVFTSLSPLRTASHVTAVTVARRTASSILSLAT